VPYPMDRGAYYRGFHLLRELARGHDVDLLALSENGGGLECKDVFTEVCHRVELVPFSHPAWARFPKRLFNPLPATVAHWTLPQAALALKRMLATERYDAVHIFDIILAQYLAGHSVPLVADRTRVDLQYQLMERRRMRFSMKARLLNLENLAKLWRFERQAASRTCLQLVCGPDDEAFIRRYIHRSVPVGVIPNGVDTAFFHPEAVLGEERSTHPTILFCGAMDYNPNIDALRWYFANIHDHLKAHQPDLRLLIVGKDPVPEVKAYSVKPNVVVTGGVPDVRPFYRRAWLQIVPLRIGGGTRLKIVESLAIGTPVLSTTIGAQGLHLRHGHDILLADSPSPFIAETRRVLADPALRRSLEEQGLQTVRSRLAWPQLGRQLSELYTAHFSRSVSGSPVEVRPIRQAGEAVCQSRRTI
jgi:glycosyltransferase involved in cell wall biosynthesis